MKLFLIDNFEPAPTEEFFMIEEFKALYSGKYNDVPGDVQGRKRIRGNKEGRFLYFYCDHKSEFAKYPEDERQKEALTAADLPEDYEISPALTLAIERYKKMCESRSIRLLNSANKAVDKLADYFSGIDFTKLDNSGKFVYDPKDLISSIGSLGKVIEGLEKLQEAVLKEEGQESSTRGAAEKGRLT